MKDTNGTQPAVDVAALAQLARLDVTPEELANLEREIPGILSFVAEVSHVSASAGSSNIREVRNVMRDDVAHNAAGAYTEDLLSQAPEREGNYVKVPQVIKK